MLIYHSSMQGCLDTGWEKSVSISIKEMHSSNPFNLQSIRWHFDFKMQIAALFFAVKAL